MSTRSAARPRVPPGHSVPHEVMRLHLVDGLSLRRATLARLAKALGVRPEQLR
ncbi:MAG TPA: hypothetical protein VGC00_11305 [Thermoanaerobaculia bacterium]